MTNAQLLNAFDAAEQAGDRVAAARIYTQLAGSIWYANLAPRMRVLWGLK